MLKPADPLVCARPVGPMCDRIYVLVCSGGSPGPSFYPYSPECVEDEFCEVRLLRGYAPRCGSWHHTYRWEGFDPLGS
jgi:hypothetical protein